MLVPGGVLGLLWNRSDAGCSWDRACHRVAHPGAAVEEDGATTAVEELPGFVFDSRAAVPWVERLSRADYVRRWQTVSSFLAASDGERARMVADVERILDAHPATAGADELDLPQITDVYIYRAVG